MGTYRALPACMQPTTLSRVSATTIDDAKKLTCMTYIYNADVAFIIYPADEHKPRYD